MALSLTLDSTLPVDGGAATLVGRAWASGAVPGPSVVVIRDGGLYDITRRYATMAALLDEADPAGAPRQAAVDAPLLSAGGAFAWFHPARFGDRKRVRWGNDVASRFERGG